MEIELTRVQPNRPVRLCFEASGPCDADSWGTIVIDNPEVGTTVRYTYHPIQIEQGIGDARIRYETDDIGHGQWRWMEMPRPAA